jgi:hypothetical protein
VYDSPNHSKLKEKGKRDILSEREVPDPYRPETIPIKGKTKPEIECRARSYADYDPEFSCLFFS